METLRASFFSLMLVHLIKKNILNFLIAILTASFVEKNHENTLCAYFAVVI